MAEYNPQQIEAKWQKRWAEARVFDTEADPAKPKYYALEMLPYPSGTMHMGHMRNYTIGDVVARVKRMRGPCGDLRQAVCSASEKRARVTNS